MGHETLRAHEKNPAGCTVIGTGGILSLTLYDEIHGMHACAAANPSASPRGSASVIHLVRLVACWPPRCGDKQRIEEPIIMIRSHEPKTRDEFTSAPHALFLSRWLPEFWRNRVCQP
ncbi:hypothetical protein POX_g08662 [Penicillium oxalicum]|uniref:hypothetical protein n=1 Tax=Penicillium oxalicum TaxID=69781 RepID=UPI0020B7DA20|nr:hypothetical protein POX_g08662 [Penicillium oxalicum]KAI2786279.1 hypothetical protein POX_g08662 [Penicillium oxalicum]